MEKRNIPKKDSNGKKDSQLRKDAIRAIKTKQLVNVAIMAVLLGVFCIGALLIYLNTAEIKVNDNTPLLFRRIVELNSKYIERKITPAAVVNNQEISVKEVDERYSLLPAQYQSLVSKEEILSQMIDEKLLIQESEKLNISVTEEEINQRIQALLDDNQITKEEFAAAVASKNLSMDAVREFYSKEIILTKLLSQEVLSNIKITDRDVRRYYSDNKDLFKIPASVNVSHLLVCHNESLRCISNLSKDEALSFTQRIRKNLTGNNFAEKALEFSYEPAAKITNGNLGWVSKESPFDATFMNATFALSPGEISEPVETVFGYHIITVFEKRNESTIGIDDVYSQINQTITAEKEKSEFGVYLSGLKNSSAIINYMEKKN